MLVNFANKVALLEDNYIALNLKCGKLRRVNPLNPR